MSENLEKSRAALTMIQPEPFNAEALHRGRHGAWRAVEDRVRGSRIEIQ